MMFKNRDEIRRLFPELPDEPHFDAMLRVLAIASTAGEEEEDTPRQRARRYRIASTILDAAARLAAALAMVEETRRAKPS